MPISVPCQVDAKSANVFLAALAVRLRAPYEAMRGNAVVVSRKRELTSPHVPYGREIDTGRQSNNQGAIHCREYVLECLGQLSQAKRNLNRQPRLRRGMCVTEAHGRSDFIGNSLHD